MWSCRDKEMLGRERGTCSPTPTWYDEKPFMAAVLPAVQNCGWSKLPAAEGGWRKVVVRRWICTTTEASTAAGVQSAVHWGVWVARWHPRVASGALRTCIATYQQPKRGALQLPQCPKPLAQKKRRGKEAAEEGLKKNSQASVTGD